VHPGHCPISSFVQSNPNPTTFLKRNNSLPLDGPQFDLRPLVVDYNYVSVVVVLWFLVLGVESVVVEAQAVEWAQVVEWVEVAYYYKKLDVQWNAVHSSKIAVAFQLFEAVKDCLVDVLPLEDLLSLLLLSSVETALIVWDLETVRDSPGDAV